MPHKSQAKPDVLSYGGFTRSEPLPVTDGIRARSQRGAFTHTWWASAWEQALLGVMDGNRLARGKSYARRGQVTELVVTPGHIDARVQGSRQRPYAVRVDIAPLSDVEWARAIDAMAQQAGYAAQLLNGEMPHEIAGLFEQLGAPLFPSVEGDVALSCSCPDSAVPCKHLAAVLLLVGESLDDDPFLLFTLRGRTEEQVARALRERRAGRAEVTDGDAIETQLPEVAPAPRPAPEAPAAPADPLERFWQLGPELENLHIRVRPPEVELQVLKVLGDPSFAQDAALVERLTRVYSAVTDRALTVAYGEPREADAPGRSATHDQANGAGHAESEGD
jgi:uncharacterized Zn finger protein